MDGKTLLNIERGLKKTIEAHAPESLKLIEQAERDNSLFLFHQDSFAAGYEYDEMALLGMIIKYAGTRGVEIRIMGTNRETLREDNKE